QVGPNAMRLLEDWGIARLVSAYATVPEGIRVFEALTGELLNTVPLGSSAESRYGSPNIVIRRAQLQKCLLEAAWTQSNLEIVTGFRLAGHEDLEDRVEAFDASGIRKRGQALIGADGLQSTIRASVHRHQPETIGKTAWRTAIRTSDAPASFADPYIGIWMAPYGHLVHYTVDAGNEIDVIAVIEDTYHFDGWGAPGDPEDLLPHFYNWDAYPLEFLEQLEGWTKWTLFSMNPLDPWGHGRVTLLGDAAHPVQPFLAQGSAMAIEDAAVLADEVRKSPADLPAALRRYEQQRVRRTARVQHASHRLGQIYHLAGLPRWVRDAVLRWRKPMSLLARYDWLYGFAPPSPLSPNAHAT
ncbi:MAG: FAD-dependent monooxygenase, partial [Methyloligellaceae bacterium]